MVTLIATASVVGVESNFQGKGNGLSGYLNIADKTFSFEYDLWQIDTDNELRNEHMHENHLETEDYPVASFKGVILEHNVDKIIAEGEFTLHGETRKLKINAKIKDRILTAEWHLNLNDYKIEIPRKFIFAKLNENLLMKINCKLIKE